MFDIPLDRIPRFAELTAWLRGFADAYPDLVELDRLGTSRDGRELWIATVTNTATGPHHAKPAVWIDANIHAMEATSSVAVLHLLRHLCVNHGTSDRVTAALDERTFYLVPRVNPDGAELALGEVPFSVRSNTRPWPRHDQAPGLVPSDVDRDGRQLQMRVVDPNGAWTTSAADPRLLVERAPDEFGGGPYYRLLTEGHIVDFDGATVTTAPPLHGVDANRNFPYHWRREPGHGGDYPTSETEVAAIVSGVIDRPNIGCYLAYHTFGGMHLRPFGDRGDDAYPTSDLRDYRALGALISERSGYPVQTPLTAFAYDPRATYTGMSIDWAYGELGLSAWITEFWNPLQAAGVPLTSHSEWYNAHPADDELRLLAWVDEHVPDGCVDWYEFEHPQLGPVEIGGWNLAEVFWNPPDHLLESELAPHVEIALTHCLAGPLLRLIDVEVTRHGESTWRLRVVVDNDGWLPTNVTQRAIEQGVVRPVEAHLRLPADATVIGGSTSIELGQLTGRSAVGRTMRQFTGVDETTDRAVATWVIHAPNGGDATVEVSHPRAGTATATIPLTTAP